MRGKRRGYLAQSPHAAYLLGSSSSFSLKAWVKNVRVICLTMTLLGILLHFRRLCKGKS